jgi:RNA polymerase sigma-70 factor (ECF subfamily)
MAAAGAAGEARSDEAIVAALRRGDERAYQLLVDQYHPALERLARAHVKDADVAMEVVQDTWVGVLRGIDRFEGKSSLKTWIFRILINRARTRSRREGRTVPFSRLAADELDGDAPLMDPSRFRGADDPWAGHWSDPPTAWSDPARAIESKEIGRHLHAAIDALPEMQRTVITLRDVQGLSSEEVCNILEISETNERVLVHRARAKVRNALDPLFRT